MVFLKCRTYYSYLKSWVLDFKSIGTDSLNVGCISYCQAITYSNNTYYLGKFLRSRSLVWSFGLGFGALLWDAGLVWISVVKWEHGRCSYFPIGSWIGLVFWGEVLGIEIDIFGQSS